MTLEEHGLPLPKKSAIRATEGEQRHSFDTNDIGLAERVLLAKVVVSSKAVPHSINIVVNVVAVSNETTTTSVYSRIHALQISAHGSRRKEPGSAMFSRSQTTRGCSSVKIAWWHYICSNERQDVKARRGQSNGTAATRFCKNSLSERRFRCDLSRKGDLPESLHDRVTALILI